MSLAEDFWTINNGITPFFAQKNMETPPLHSFHPNLQLQSCIEEGCAWKSWLLTDGLGVGWLFSYKNPPKVGILNKPILCNGCFSWMMMNQSFGWGNGWLHYYITISNQSWYMKWMFRVPGICLIHGSWFSSICWKSWSLLRMEMHRLKMQCRSLTFQVFHLPSLPHLKDFNQNLVAKLADIIQSGPLLAINEVIIPLISGFWTKPQWNP